MPLLFILNWKTLDNGSVKAHGRVCLQCFKHEDAVSQDLGKQSPTMSRLARHLLLETGACRHWRCFEADVADAFLQGVDLHDVGSRTLECPARTSGGAWRA